MRNVKKHDQRPLIQVVTWQCDLYHLTLHNKRVISLYTKVIFSYKAVS